MRLSRMLLPTGFGNDDHSDLLSRAGYTHRLADGVYSLLPLGQRVLQRIGAIVRREMERAGGQEVTMPLLQPEGLWHRRIGDGETRASAFGSQLFRLLGQQKDRLVLAPTHEEVAAILAAACVREASDVPRVIFQIQPRFRDQACGIEDGLLRTREFVMADAYSFHADRASLDESYAAIKEAFCSIVAACGVRFEVVRADMGAMGGAESEELVAPLPNSTATAAVQCGGCGYAASVEIAEFARAGKPEEAPFSLEEVAVPDGLSVEDTTAWLGLSSARRLTSQPFVLAGDRIVLAVIPGGLFLNPVKLVNALASAGFDTTGLRAASAQDLISFGADYNWISLVRTPSSVVVLADEAVRAGANFFVPSTRAGHFLINVNCGRDFRVDMFADLGVAGEGALCVRCGKTMGRIQGIEVGHVFKLGPRYAEAFGARITDSSAVFRPLEMGCYGLGITRLMAAIVEQGRDARGIIWPEQVTPYLAVILPLQQDAVSRRVAEELYAELTMRGLDVLLDDSDAGSQQKIRRADLLGIPVQIVLSGDLEEGDMVEVVERASAIRHRLPANEVGALVRSRGRRKLPS